MRGDGRQRPDQSIDIQMLFDQSDQAIEVSGVQGMIVGGH